MARLESAHQTPVRAAWFDSVTIFTTAIDARDLWDISDQTGALSAAGDTASVTFQPHSLYSTRIHGYTNETASRLSHSLHNSNYNPRASKFTSSNLTPSLPC